MSPTLRTHFADCASHHQTQGSQLCHSIGIPLIVFGLLALLQPMPLGLFVFGWILQFVGHYVYEKRSPAFLKNLTHLLVGPLWILAKATRRA